MRTTRYESRVAGREQPGDYPRDRVHASLHAEPGRRDRDLEPLCGLGLPERDQDRPLRGVEGHDVALRWRGPFGIDRLNLAGGVLNVGDRGPSINPAEPNEPLLRLDSVMGRTLFLNATLSSGP